MRASRSRIAASRMGVSDSCRSAGPDGVRTAAVQAREEPVVLLTQPRQLIEERLVGRLPGAQPHGWVAGQVVDERARLGAFEVVERALTIAGAERAVDGVVVDTQLVGEKVGAQLARLPALDALDTHDGALVFRERGHVVAARRSRGGQDMMALVGEPLDVALARGSERQARVELGRQAAAETE